jgi:hypothetical protein
LDNANFANRFAVEGTDAVPTAVSSAGHRAKTPGDLPGSHQDKGEGLKNLKAEVLSKLQQPTRGALFHSTQTQRQTSLRMSSQKETKATRNVRYLCDR